ncbi:TerD family protein [Kitasatospora camelliae]|uniref:TerD family protein n=1 Tax=Kitasatospora camelliae TaxID=3156397 RepID=A0AAU8K3F9_9ACTN
MAAAELVRGQNHPLPGTRITVRVPAGGSPAVAVLLTDEDGRVPAEPGRVAHHGAPEPPGVLVTGPAGAGQEAALDLDALPAGVARLMIALVLPPGAGTFGALAAPTCAVAGPDGAEVARFTLAGLGPETAVVALEVYRRNGTWKVRAVGQGYAGGAEALLRDHGVADPAAAAAALTPPVAADTPSVPAGRGPGAPIDTAHPRRPAPTASGTGAGTGDAGMPPQPDRAVGTPIDTAHPRRPAPTPAGGSPLGLSDDPYATAPNGTPPGVPAAEGFPPPVAGDAAGWTMDERLYNQVWGIFEDAARSAAAYRSAVDYADTRQEREVEALLSDPRTRFGPDAEFGRMQARERRDELEARAREVLDRDAAQLLAEIRVVEEAMPAPMASWSSPAWDDWQPLQEPPYGLRIGDLHLPENPGLKVPLLVRLPLQRGLWVDSGAVPEGAGSPEAELTDPAELKAAAVRVAAATAARLLASYPPAGLRLHAVAPGGDAAGLLAPFTRAGLLAGAPATGAASVTALLDSLVERVDLVQMARRARASDALPPHVDPADRLLLVHDFPYGFDDRTVATLRYLAEEGPSVGVFLLLVADRAEAREYGPVLDPFWRGLTRLAPVPQEYLADPWVEHLWTYTPLVPEAGPGGLPALLERLAWPGGAAR